jgi:hypothetical protein
VRFETAGLPAAVVVLDTFESLARMKKRQMGLPDLEVITVPGPMGTAAEARAKGEAALADVVRWLTRGPSPT